MLPSAGQAALAYAARGWPAFPIHGIVDGRCDCGKAACNAGKHPWTRRGFKDATTDRAKIEAAFLDRPSANVAVITGVASGLLVVDVDPRNGGQQSLRGLHMPPTLTNRTGGAGLHYLYRITEALPKLSGALPGVDLQADGAYVVMPPSLHISGRRYEPADCAKTVEPAPAWVLEALRERAARQNDPKPKRRVRLEEVKEGERNQTLFLMACGLANGAQIVNGKRRGCFCGADHCESLEHLTIRMLGANKKLPQPLSRDEVVTVCRNALRKAREGWARAS